MQNPKAYKIKTTGYCYCYYCYHSVNVITSHCPKVIILSGCNCTLQSSFAQRFIFHSLFFLSTKKISSFFDQENTCCCDVILWIAVVPVLVPFSLSHSGLLKLSLSPLFNSFSLSLSLSHSLSLSLSIHNFLFSFQLSFYLFSLSLSL